MNVEINNIKPFQNYRRQLNFVQRQRALSDFPRKVSKTFQVNIKSKRVSFVEDQIIYQYGKSPKIHSQSEQPAIYLPEQLQLPKREIQQKNDTNYVPSASESKIAFIVGRPTQRKETPKQSKIRRKNQQSSLAYKSNNIQGKPQKIDANDCFYSVGKRINIESPCIYCNKNDSNSRLACAHAVHIECFLKNRSTLCSLCQSKNKY